jgi:serine/threonine protein kinase
MVLFRRPAAPTLRPFARVEFAGRYFIEGEIGAGRSSSVYSATDCRGGKVALKIGNPVPWDREVLGNEAKALARCSHQGIVKLLSCGEFRGFPYLAMELVEGETLNDHMRKSKAGPTEGLGYSALICDALSSMHSAGVVHRDLKPKNVMVRNDGAVSIIDFGFALVDGMGMEGSFRMGHPLYMAPEQNAKGSICDHRADIHAVGVMLYQMLTRPRSLMRAIDLLRISGFSVGGMLASGYSWHAGAEGLKIAARAIEKEPGMRFQSACEMRRAIEALLGEKGK